MDTVSSKSIKMYCQHIRLLVDTMTKVSLDDN